MPKEIIGETYLDIKEVAMRLGLHVQTIKRYIADGTFKATKVGNKWYIKEVAIKEYLDKRSKIVEQTPAA